MDGHPRGRIPLCCEPGVIVNRAVEIAIGDLDGGDIMVAGGRRRYYRQRGVAGIEVWSLKCPLCISTTTTTTVSRT
jgi:hypothetical protein